MSSDPVRTLIVDDEPEAREGVRALLEAMDGFEVVAVCAGGRPALDALEDGEVELLVLDIQMPVVDGFDVLRALPDERRPVVVFMTAYDRYAVDAFEATALDYLLKPFTDERFARAMERARRQVKRRRLGEWEDALIDLVDRLRGSGAGTGRPDPAEAPTGPLRRLLIKDRSGARFVAVDDIDWIGSADYYVEIHAGERTHLLRETMKTLERRLPADRFVRAHRSAIVNLDRVEALDESGARGATLVLVDGTRLPVARSRKSDVWKALVRSQRGPR